MRRLLSAALAVALVTVGLSPVGVGDVATVGASTSWSTQLVSIGDDGSQGNGASRQGRAGDGGRFVVFDSAASNLVPGDVNGVDDVFVRDTVAGTTERVSVSSSGVEGNGASRAEPQSSESVSRISADGRFVVFASWADNLVAGDLNGEVDVFLRDRVGGTTSWVSAPTQPMGFSTGSFAPSISVDGTTVVFFSRDPLVAADVDDGTTHQDDAYVYDVASGALSLATLDSQIDSRFQFYYVEGIAVSGFGRCVVFAATIRARPGVSIPQAEYDANRTLYDQMNTYLLDRETGQVELVSVRYDGKAVGRTLYPTVSEDCRRVAYASANDVLYANQPNGSFDDQVYVQDRTNGEVFLVTEDVAGGFADNASWHPVLDPSGRMVVFQTYAADLVAGDTNGQSDVFLRVLPWGQTQRVSVAPDGTQVAGNSGEPSFSTDGTKIVFTSGDDGLVVGDSNARSDVFVTDAPELPHIERDEAELRGWNRNSTYSSDPVNTATGNFVFPSTDLVMPESTFGLGFNRFYNSRDDRLGPLGQGWSSTYDVRIVDDAGAVRLIRDDGRHVVFRPDGAGGWVRPEEFRGALAADADGSYRVDLFDGDRWDFGADGWLTSLTDWTGQTVTLSRNADGYVTSALSSTGRSLTFSHNPLSGRLVSVTSDDGRTTAYGYNTDGHLASVTDPTGATATITANASGLITDIHDGAGRLVISNDYDTTGRVIVQRSPHGGTTSFTYDDQTGETIQVDMPSGDTTVFAHDRLGRTVSITDAAGQALTRSFDGSGEIVAVQDRRAEMIGQSFDARGNLLSRTHRDGRIDTLAYDSLDRLTSLTEPSGDTWVYTYDGVERLPSTVTAPDLSVTIYDVIDGLVAQVTDADGVTTQFSHDTARNLVSVTDALANSTTFGHDGAGRVTEVTTPLGHTTGYSYDAVGRVLSITDANNATTSYAYDQVGNVAAVTDPLSHATTATYTAANDVATVTDRDGNTTAYTYNNDGDLVTAVAPGGATTTYTYGPLGRITSVTDPEGGTTSYTYNPSGNLATVTDPVAGVTSYTYDADGRIATVADGTGNTTSHTYDSEGRLATVTDPERGVTAYTYTPDGQLASVTTPAGGTTTYSYTPAGRLSRTTDPDGVTVDYGYDPAGRATTESNALGSTWTTSYDADGRIATESSPLGLTTTYGHDPLGQITSVEDSRGGTTTYTWSARGEMLSTTDPVGGTTAYTYTPDENLAAVTDPNGHSTSFGYDTRHNLTARTDPAGNTTTWAYDLADRPTTTTDPLGRATSYTYDAASQLTHIGDPSGRAETRRYDPAGWITGHTWTEGTDTYTVDYTFDRNHRRVSMIDAAGTTSYTYDPDGRLTATTDATGHTTGYQYTPAGRRSSLTYPDGRQLGYTYDTAGQLTGTTGLALTVGYDADGRVTAESVTGDEHLERTYEYTGPDLTGYTENRHGVTRAWTLAHDLAGQLSSKSHAGTTTSYGYDPASQLVTVAVDGVTTEAYEYNQLGQRTTKTQGAATTTYTYGPAGQLQTARLVDDTQDPTTTSYQWDPAGRLTTIDGPVTDRIIDYDPRGKPARTTTQVVGLDSRYEVRGHDGNGTLTDVRITDSAGNVYADDHFTWDPTLAVPEILHVDAAATLHADSRFIYTPTGRAAVEQNTATAPLSRDPHGNTVIHGASPDGDLDWARDATYNPWGEPATADAITPKLGYREELHLANTIHLRNRDYLPDEAIFTTTDPLPGVPGTTTLNHPYHYTNNNPLNLTDPLGLRPDDGTFDPYDNSGALSDPAYLAAVIQAQADSRARLELALYLQDHGQQATGACSDSSIRQQGANLAGGVLNATLVGQGDRLTRALGIRSNYCAHSGGYQIGTGAATAVSLSGAARAIGSRVVPGLRMAPRMADDFVDLSSSARRRHILDGEVRPNGTFGGGHRAGTGFPGKTEFPAGWSDDLIMHHVSDVATDPASRIVRQQGRDVFVRGVRDGREIEVLLRNGEIWTAYPIP